MLAQLHARPHLILAIVRYQHRLSGSVSQHKAVVTLVDGSKLHINEVWLHGHLRKYAYYWLSPTNDRIMGWDNAPHHPHIATSPHHVHTPSGITSSSIRCLKHVLDELEKRLLSSPHP